VSSGLRAVLLTEAGPSIGLGHLTRCTALYDALEALGCTCELVVSGSAPDHVIGSRSCRVFEWHELGSAAAAVRQVDIAVVDSYLAELPAYEAIVAEVAVAVYLDDTARLAYPGGIVVNGNPAADELDFSASANSSLLLGVRYQLLRAEFREAPEREIGEHISRVLVVSGGSDAGGVRAAMAKAAERAFPQAHVDVVDSSRTAAEMRDSMLAADLALSAAGQTLYELAATATPTVAVCVADNQLAQARAFEAAGAAVLAGEWGSADISQAMVAGLKGLQPAGFRGMMAQAGRALVDGMGSLRVARRAIGTVLAERISMRPAVAEDEVALLELANDPAVRATAFSPRAITPEEHHLWFSTRLASEQDLMLLALDGAQLVAYVRFDLRSGDAELSIGLAEDYRGYGLGAVLIEQAVNLLDRAATSVDSVVARVRNDNEDSRRVFEQSGFVEVRSPQDVAYRVYRRSL